MNVAQLQRALGRLTSPAAAEKPDLAGYEAQGGFLAGRGGSLHPGLGPRPGCRASRAGLWQEGCLGLEHWLLQGLWCGVQGAGLSPKEPSRKKRAPPGGGGRDGVSRVPGHRQGRLPRQAGRVEGWGQHGQGGSPNASIQAGSLWSPEQPGPVATLSPPGLPPRDIPAGRMRRGPSPPLPAAQPTRPEQEGLGEEGGAEAVERWGAGPPTTVTSALAAGVTHAGQQCAHKDRTFLAK